MGKTKVLAVLVSVSLGHGQGWKKLKAGDDEPAKN
jgi:hypothetical protein